MRRKKIIKSENQVARRKYKDIEVPLLALGCMRLPMQGDEVDMQELERMVEYCMQHGANYFDTVGRENIIYISVANRLSVDCDCDSNPHEPEMADIGIFASLDPVAIDQACVDAVYNSPDEGKAALIERMESRNGIHTVETAAALGLGNREYEIIKL